MPKIISPVKQKAIIKTLEKTHSQILTAQRHHVSVDTVRKLRRQMRRAGVEIVVGPACAFEQKVTVW